MEMDLIVIEGQSYLASPWPTEPEVFWRRVWDTGSTLVVNLAGGSMQYLALESSTIGITLESEEDRGPVRVRELRLSVDRKQRPIIHIEFPAWMDFGVPDRESFLFLLNTVDELAKSRPGPITVHCLAGCGRTGTFIAAHLLWVLETAPPLKTLLDRIRAQRKGLVETPEQEAFAESFWTEKGKGGL